MSVGDIVNCCKTREESDDMCADCPVANECTTLMHWLSEATPNMLPDILDKDY